MKATYCEVFDQEGYNKHTDNGNMMCSTEQYDSFTDCREIWKDPITDDGTKKSAKGLLSVIWNPITNRYDLHDQQSWETESKGALETVFKDGVLVKKFTLDEVKVNLKKHDN